MALFAIRRGDFVVVVVFVESEPQPKREVTRLRLASVVPRVRVLAASRASIQRRGKSGSFASWAVEVVVRKRRGVADWILLV